MSISTWIKGAVRYLLLALALSGLLLLLAIGMLLDRQPFVYEREPGTVSEATRVKRLGQTLYKAYFYSRKRTDSVSALSRDTIQTLPPDGAQVEIHEADLNSAFAVLQRSTSGRLSAHIHMLPTSADITLSFRIFRSRYLNIKASLLSSKKGVVFGQMTIGPVDLAGKKFMKLIQVASDIFLGQHTGRRLINAVASIDTHDGRITAVIQSDRQLGSQRVDILRTVLTSLSLLDDRMIDIPRVQHYFQLLTQISQAVSLKEFQPLSAYMKPLFHEAQLQSQDSRASAENAAALLALAIYLGDGRLESVIGPVSKKIQLPSRKITDKVLLANRKDLRQHFVISIALRVLSDSGMSFAIGELKELMDAGQGGSGFSFVDLAADRAGIQFALLATNPLTAVGLQERMSMVTDNNLFFPNISGLKEGLTEQEFIQQYGNTESEAYQAMLVEVDQRIADTPLLQQLKSLQ